MSTTIKSGIDIASGSSLRDGRIIPKWATHIAVSRHAGNPRQTEFAALSEFHGGYIDCDPNADSEITRIGATVGLYNPEVWQFIPVSEIASLRAESLI